jgi:hypothetical protein
MINLDLTKICDVTVEGIDRRDHPDYCDAYIADAWIEIDADEFNKTAMPTNNKGFKLFRQLSEAELDWLNDSQRDFVFAQVEKWIY